MSDRQIWIVPASNNSGWIVKDEAPPQELAPTSATLNLARRVIRFLDHRMTNRGVTSFIPILPSEVPTHFVNFDEVEDRHYRMGIQLRPGSSYTMGFDGNKFRAECTNPAKPIPSDTLLVKIQAGIAWNQTMRDSEGELISSRSIGLRKVTIVFVSDDIAPNEPFGSCRELLYIDNRGQRWHCNRRPATLNEQQQWIAVNGRRPYCARHGGYERSLREVGVAPGTVPTSSKRENIPPGFQWNFPIYYEWYEHPR